MFSDWNEKQIERLGERVDRIEKQMRDEKQRSIDRKSQAMVFVIWLEVAAIWAFSIVRAAGI